MSAAVALQDGVVIPAEVVSRLVAQVDTVHTDEWFAALPPVIEGWCNRWDITLEPELPRLTYNVVIFGTSRSLGPVVLKLSPPHPEFLAELEGLRQAQGPGVVRLFHADSKEAGMLLERVVPGTPLRDQQHAYDDTTATRIAAICMQRFWQPVAACHDHDLIPLARWFRALFDYEALLAAGKVSGPLPASLARVAVQSARALLAAGHERYLLHGDIHHDNILANQHGGWTIIDPKGLVGDRSYEIGTWMLNTPWLQHERDRAELLRQRVDVFATELDMSRDRVIAGGLVHAVLAACWSLQDNDGPAESGDRADDPWLAASIETAQILHALGSE